MKTTNKQTCVFSAEEVRELLMTAAGIRDGSGVVIDHTFPDQVTLVYEKSSHSGSFKPQTKRGGGP